MSHLYIVATPIGNLEDISQRALKTLNQVDFILCEDTRRTKKLLNHFEVKTPVISYHHHSKLKKINYILKLLSQGKDLALVSDAGTPGIADPGGKLIKEIRKNFDQEQVTISPIPGPSAITAAASIAGIPLNHFLFLGFAPKKKKRKKFFREIAQSKYPVVFFESPHRILKTLKELTHLSHSEPSTTFLKSGAGRRTPQKVHKTRDSCLAGREASLHPTGFAQNDVLKIIVCRELTKIHEQILRGTADEIINQLKNNSPSKGEYTIIIYQK